MPRELVYTSAAAGMRPGQSGFCTVRATAGLDRRDAERLERLSGYRHLGAAAQSASRSAHPVCFQHLRLQLSDGPVSVLSRIADAGRDYTNRSNSLAHHLVLDGPLPPAGPAAVAGRPGLLLTEWTGNPGEVPARPPLSPRDRPPSGCRHWARLGDAGWAGLLAEAVLQRRPAVLIVPPALDTRSLLEEAIALLPAARRWDATFTTYDQGLGPDVDCLIRCAIAGTPEAARPPRNALVLDLTAPLPPATGPAADAARAGQSIVQASAKKPRKTAAAAVPPLPPGADDLGPLGELPSNHGKMPATARPISRRSTDLPWVVALVIALIVAGLATAWVARDAITTAINGVQDFVGPADEPSPTVVSKDDAHPSRRGRTSPIGSASPSADADTGADTSAKPPRPVDSGPKVVATDTQTVGPADDPASATKPPAPEDAPTAVTEEMAADVSVPTGNDPSVDEAASIEAAASGTPEPLPELLDPVPTAIVATNPVAFSGGKPILAIHPLLGQIKPDGQTYLYAEQGNGSLTVEYGNSDFYDAKIDSDKITITSETDVSRAPKSYWVSILADNDRNVVYRTFPTSSLRPLHGSSGIYDASLGSAFESPSSPNLSPWNFGGEKNFPATNNDAKASQSRLISNLTSTFLCSGLAWELPPSPSRPMGDWFAVDETLSPSGSAEIPRLTEFVHQQFESLFAAAGLTPPDRKQYTARVDYSVPTNTEDANAVRWTITLGGRQRLKGHLDNATEKIQRGLRSDAESTMPFKTTAEDNIPNREYKKFLDSKYDVLLTTLLAPLTPDKPTQEPLDKIFTDSYFTNSDSRIPKNTPLAELIASGSNKAWNETRPLAEKLHARVRDVLKQRDEVAALNEALDNDLRLIRGQVFYEAVVFEKDDFKIFDKPYPPGTVLKFNELERVRVPLIVIRDDAKPSDPAPASPRLIDADRAD